jgi:4-hydroxy-2-oxoglutarate aldolase
MFLDGLYVPLTAPFYRDGALYLRKLEHNVDRYSRTPASGFVAFAQHGEGYALTSDEVKQSLHSISALAAPEKVLLAGLPASSAAAALELAEAAAVARFDAVVVGLPPVVETFERPLGSYEKQVMTWFGTLADRSPLPVVIASGEGRMQIALHAMKQLATHPNVIGVIDSALDAERLRALQRDTAAVQREVSVTTVFAAVTARMLQTSASGAPATFISADSLGSGAAAVAVAPPVPALKTRTKVVGFQILAAGSGAMLPQLEARVNGLLPSLAACAPQACHEVLAAFRDGNAPLALLKEQRLARAQSVVVEELGVAGIKYACDLNGYFGGTPRLPLLDLTAEHKARVEAALYELRN